MGAGKSKSELNLPNEDSADTQAATTSNELAQRRACISSKHLLWGMFIFTALWCVALCITAFSTMDSINGCEDYTGSQDYLKDQLQSIQAAIIFMFLTVLFWGVWSSLVLMQKFVVWGCGGTSNPFLSWGILIASTFYGSLNIFAMSVILTLWETTMDKYDYDNGCWDDDKKMTYVATYSLGYICTALLLLLGAIFFFRRPAMERVDKQATNSV